MGIRDLARRHKRLIAMGAVLGAGLLIFVLVWFQPQQAFLQTTVEETLPPAGRAPSEPGDAGEGAFRNLSKETTGQAQLVELDDGSFIVRIKDLATSNGPDLRVYLSRASADADGREFAEDFIDLGALKGNRGDQNYEVPDGVDVSRFRSVVIWCRRFTVGFGVASIV